MPLAFEEYGDAIGSASTVLRANAGSAGLDAAVPTCPEWTVADLVVHQGMVHRWATDIISGAGPTRSAEHADAGRASHDLLGWFDEGATGLLQVLADAPEDLDVKFFLPDAPPPRLAWARRQAHETTIHAIDAMSARLGQAPRAEDLWFTDGLALDGIDEILTGFVTRPTSQLRSPEPRTLIVDPDGTEMAWAIEIGPNAATTSRTAPGASGDGVVRGSARAAYLGLWNRGPLEVGGGEALARLWATTVQVRWSR